MTDEEKLFTEDGWIIEDKDLPKKRKDKTKAKAVKTSADKYLNKKYKKPTPSISTANPSPTTDVKSVKDGEDSKKKKKKKKKEKRIMVICAHPDDADLLTGGLALRVREKGYKVKYVSVTNGDLGHHEKSPAEIAFIRENEGAAAAAALGAEFECLGVHDGHVWVNDENTRKIIKVMREFKPDLVITHRPNDYHRDHRYTGQLVMDASYMYIVPHYCPEFPPQTRDMPIICYAWDNFKRPNKFTPDVFLNITDIFDQKVAAVSNHESQLFEWIPWTIQMEDVINEETDDDKRLELVGMVINNHFGSITEHYYDLLKKAFPDKECVSFEAFEICEYGKQPTKAELKKLFPGAYFPKQKELEEYYKE